MGGVAGRRARIFHRVRRWQLVGEPDLPGAFQDHELLFNAEVVAAPTSSAVIPACTEDGRVAVSVATDPATRSLAVRSRIDGGRNSGTGAEQRRVGERPALPAHPRVLGRGPGAPAGDPTSQRGTPIGGLHPRHGAGASPARARDRDTREVAAGIAAAQALTTDAGRHDDRLQRNGAGEATITFARAKPGRRIGRRCACSPTRRNRARRRCTRLLRAGSLILSAHAGTNKVRFQGRLSRSKKLKPGRYTLTITAVDSAGNKSAAKSTSFTIVRG